MAYSKVTLRIPDIKESWSNFSTKNGKLLNTEMLKRIDRNYGAICSKWEPVFDLPKGVIVAMIATESGGTMAPPNRFKATGLMQVTPNAVWETGRKWGVQVDKPLPTSVTSALTSKVGRDFFSSKSSTPGSSHTANIFKGLQYDADFSIMCGCMVLRWCIERFSNPIMGGNLNKAVVAYNVSAYTPLLNTRDDRGRPTRTPDERPVDTTTLASRGLPVETRAYLVKMFGVDGFLSLIYRDKVISA